MNTRNTLLALGGSLLLGSASVAQAESTGDADLRQEISVLKSRLSELENKEDQSWLNERQTEEVRSLITEVIADADTRASMLADGTYAGYVPGKGFTLSSEDGSAELNMWGQIQIRYVYNHNQRPGGGGGIFAPALGASRGDNDVAGFEVRRARLGFEGHIENATYGLLLSADRNTSAVNLLEAWAGYNVADNLELRVGRFKAPFAREELIRSKDTLAVDRGIVNEMFTLERAEGIQLAYHHGDDIVVRGMFSDGLRSGEVITPYLTGAGGVGGLAVFAGRKDFLALETDFAFTGRVDLQLRGDASQMQDFRAWGEEQALSVGAALHYQEEETGTGAGPRTLLNSLGDVTVWTVDTMYKEGNWVAMGALFGLHRDPADAAAAPVGGDTEKTFGLSLQAGYSVNEKVQPFARYEWMWGDFFDDTLPTAIANPSTSGDIHVFTAGANYFINPAAKFTADVVWGIGPNGTGAIPSGLGFTGSQIGLIGGSNDEVALRGQLQLMF